MSDLQDVASNVADPRASPEAQAITRERYDHLMNKLRQLSHEERLLVRLRFEQELTLDQIAKLLNVGNAQRVDRQLKQILSQLREETL
jgi:RNA polymerase sigma factor (sigma-70 family)